MIRKLLEVAGLVSRDASSNAIRNVNAEEAKVKLADPKVVLLDVRSRAEYDGGHIKHAMLIPLNELATRIGELGPGSGRSILVYCRSGMRSRAASTLLAQHGFAVMNLKGGVTSWSAAGFPTERR